MKIIKKYLGKGTLHYNGKTHKINFNIQQSMNGQIIGKAKVISDKFALFLIPKAQVFINGKTNDGFKFCDHEIWITHLKSNIPSIYGYIEFKMHDLNLVKDSPVKEKILLRFYIVNLRFTGILFNEKLASSSKRDRTQIKIDMRNVKIIQVDGYNEILKKLEITKGQSVTSFLEFEYDKKKIISAIKLVNNLCFLMSFATGCRVNWVTYRVISDGSVVFAHHTENLAYRYRYIGFPVIPGSMPGTLNFEHFLTKSYKYYKQWQSRLKINQVIEYQLLAKQETVSDVAVLFASVAMESLKYQYKKWKKLPNKNPKTKRKWSFEEVLCDCFQYFGMRRKKFHFIRLRNQVIHSGRLKGSFRISFLPHYLRLLNIIDRLILKMLKYRGLYIDVRTQKEITFRN
ncbi:MAG: hypothetical protein KAT05_07150 [Spirochaetes bacterium]|nr:hypothetical protein [Spirochaetota bacterium]